MASGATVREASTTQPNPNFTAQVKALTHLKKKTEKDLREFNFRLDAIKIDYDNNMKVLKSLYNRVEKTTTVLFDGTTYRGLVHWAKLHEQMADKRVNDSKVNIAKVVRSPAAGSVGRLAINADSIKANRAETDEILKYDAEYHALNASFNATYNGIVASEKDGNNPEGNFCVGIQSPSGTRPGTVPNLYSRKFANSPTNLIKTRGELIQSPLKKIQATNNGNNNALNEREKIMEETGGGLERVENRNVTFLYDE